MKKKLASTLLMIFSVTVILKAQTASNNPKSISKEKLSVLNFIKGISFTPSGLLQINFTRRTEMHEESNNKTSEVFPSNLIEGLGKMQFKYSMMMDVAVEVLSNVTLYKFIDDWYGTRYRMGGTTKRGIDCSAFTGSLLFFVYGFSVPRTAREQYKASEHLNKEELKEGDLVFFNTKGGVSHVGLYLSNNHFVHSSSSNGVMISSLDDPYYSHRFIAGGRINRECVL